MKGLKNMGKNKNRRNKNKHQNSHTINGTPVMRPKNQGAQQQLPLNAPETTGTPVTVSKGPQVAATTKPATETPSPKDEVKPPTVPAPATKEETKPTATGMTEGQKLEAQMMAWNYLNKVHYGQFKEAELGDHSIPGEPMHNWFVQGDSTYLIHKNKIGMFGVKTSETGMPGLPTMITAPAFIKLYVPKIPEHIYRQIVSFFRKVMDKVSNSEAFAQVYYDTTERKYVVHVPDQEVSGARVKYDTKKNLDIVDAERYIFVFECHSHNSMRAFFSGVDDADEKETRIYGVFGELNKEMYAEKFRIVVNGNYLTLSAKQIFDIDEPKPIEFPKEWLDKVKPAYSRSYYGQSYGQHHKPSNPHAGIGGGGAGHHRFPGGHNTAGQYNRETNTWGQDNFNDHDFPSSADYESNYWDKASEGEHQGMVRDEGSESPSEVESMEAVESTTDELIQATDGFTEQSATWAFANCIHQYGMVEDVKKALDDFVG